MPRSPRLLDNASPQDALARLAAVNEAKQRYPRIAKLLMALTYNPNRAWNSETYPPREEGNPQPGKWTVDMGRAPYAQKPGTWPELVGLEALHGLQDTDPTYQQFIARLIASYSPEQMRNAKNLFNLYTKQGDVPGKPGAFNSPEFRRYLGNVDAQEVVRGRLWGKLFHDTEHPYADAGANNPWEGYSPKQIRLLDDLQSYLQSKD